MNNGTKVTIKADSRNRHDTTHFIGLTATVFGRINHETVQVHFDTLGGPVAWLEKDLEAVAS